MTSSQLNPLGASPAMKSKAKEKALRETEQRAFDSAFTNTRKEIAKAEGYAAGIAAAGGAGIPDGAVARARARALGQTQAATAPRPRPVSSQPAAPSGRMIKQPDGRLVPEEFYSLSADEQRRFKELQDEQEQEAKAESRFDQTAMQLLDLRDRDSKEVKALKAQVATLAAAVEAQQRTIEEMSTTIEVQKSAELAEQLARIGEAVVGASAVETSLRNQTSASAVEMDRQRDDHRDRLAATEKVMTDHENRLRTSGVLFGERAAAVEGKLATVEGSLASAEVAQADINNGIEQNRQTLKVVSGIDLQSEIDSSVRRSFEQQLEPEMAALVERKYVLLAPTSGSDGYDPKPEGYDEAFLAQQMGDNPTQRAVDQAIKRSKRKRG